MYVDAIDANIIRLLQSNGRATLEELSQATGRSSSQCQRRQKRLESVGIIKRYVALVAPDAVGYPVQVFTLVSVERDEADTFDRFEEAIRAEPTIIHAAIVAGTSDILFWAVARDLAGYRELLRRLTDAFPTLRSVTTFVMLEEIKPGFAVPVEALGDEEPVSRPFTSAIRFLGAQPSNKKAHGDAVQTEQCMDEQGYVYSTSHLCSVRYPKVGAECYSTTWRAKPVTVERPRFSRRRMPSLPTMP